MARLGAWLPRLMPFAKAERRQSLDKLGNVRQLILRQIASDIVTMGFRDVTCPEN